MLRRLSVENYALIEKLEMELDPREQKTVELSLAERGLSFVYASFLRAKENKEIETGNSK